MNAIDFTRWSLNFFEMGACLTGFIQIKKFKNNYLFAFPFYLLTIVLLELTGKYLNAYVANHSYNINLYRYFGIPVQFLFFYWLFGKCLRQYRLNVLSVIAVVIYAIAFLLEDFFLSSKREWYNSSSEGVGILLLLILIFSYFSKMVFSDEILSYKTNPLFWISAGLALYYIGRFPLYALRNILIDKYYDSIFMPYWYVTMILDCIMYLFFIFSFLWGKVKS